MQEGFPHLAFSLALGLNSLIRPGVSSAEQQDAAAPPRWQPQMDRSVQ